jgi:asparagine synthase (glutamine-hydrolysing)
LAVNGEIYNHQELRKEFPDYEFLTQSDCEVILALYRRDGKDFIEKLNGIFAFFI